MLHRRRQRATGRRLAGTDNDNTLMEINEDVVMAGNGITKAIRDGDGAGSHSADSEGRQCPSADLYERGSQLSKDGPAGCG